MNIKNNQNINIAVIGYGDFGMNFVIWNEQNMKYINIIYIVEPDESKHDAIKNKGYLIYKKLYDVPLGYINKTDIFVDCAANGKGAENLEIYKQLNIPAVFQNGENLPDIDIYYSGLYKENVNVKYLRIAKCSAMSTIRVIQSINTEKLGNINRIHAYHFKVNNRDNMLTMDYKSGDEIKNLTGVETRIDVVYLRGKSHNGYAYHGSLQIEMENEVEKQNLITSLLESSHVVVKSQNIDTLTHERDPKTYIISESITINKNIINLMVLTFTPEINFPQNENAIRLLFSNRVNNGKGVFNLSGIQNADNVSEYL
ncbi:MAG: hypothetical protein ACD_26C00022G0003 [uncultured bacterium]|nr:MAG: hypothetical protein ACD_26C00022G0003 [uncultured bacterium]